MPFHPTIVLFLDRESHEDALVTEVTEDLLPQAKVPLFQRDHITSKKAQAMRKDQKRQEAKLRMRGNFEYPLFGKDKHQSDIVSLSIEVHLMLATLTLMFSVILKFILMLNTIFQTVLLMVCVLTAGSMPKKAGWSYPEDEGHLQSRGSFIVPA